VSVGVHREIKVSLNTTANFMMKSCGR